MGGLAKLKNMVFTWFWAWAGGPGWNPGHLEGGGVTYRPKRAQHGAKIGQAPR